MHEIPGYFLQLFKLTVIECGIGAAFCQKFFVIALFDNITVFHEQNIIGVPDS